MERIKIEEGVEIPFRRWRKQNTWRKFLQSLKAGESFMVSTIKERDVIAASARRCGIRIATRHVDNGMIRIWRTL